MHTTEPRYPSASEMPYWRELAALNQCRNALERLARTTAHNNSPAEIAAISNAALENLAIVAQPFSSRDSKLVLIKDRIYDEPDPEIVRHFARQDREGRN